MGILEDIGNWLNQFKQPGTNVTVDDQGFGGSSGGNIDRGDSQVGQEAIGGTTYSNANQIPPGAPGYTGPETPVPAQPTIQNQVYNPWVGQYQEEQPLDKRQAAADNYVTLGDNLKKAGDSIAEAFTPVYNENSELNPTIGDGGYMIDQAAQADQQMFEREQRDARARANAIMAPEQKDVDTENFILGDNGALINTMADNAYGSATPSGSGLDVGHDANQSLHTVDEYKTMVNEGVGLYGPNKDEEKKHIMEVLDGLDDSKLYSELDLEDLTKDQDHAGYTTTASLGRLGDWTAQSLNAMSNELPNIRTNIAGKLGAYKTTDKNGKEINGYDLDKELEKQIKDHEKYLRDNSDNIEQREGGYLVFPDGTKIDNDRQWDYMYDERGIPTGFYYADGKGEEVDFADRDKNFVVNPDGTQTINYGWQWKWNFDGEDYDDDDILQMTADPNIIATMLSRYDTKDEYDNTVKNAGKNATFGFGNIGKPSYYGLEWDQGDFLPWLTDIAASSAPYLTLPTTIADVGSKAMLNAQGAQGLGRMSGQPGYEPVADIATALPATVTAGTLERQIGKFGMGQGQANKLFTLNKNAEGPGGFEKALENIESRAAKRLTGNEAVNPYLKKFVNPAISEAIEENITSPLWDWESQGYDLYSDEATNEAGWNTGEYKNTGIGGRMANYFEDQFAENSVGGAALGGAMSVLPFMRKANRQQLAAERNAYKTYKRTGLDPEYQVKADDLTYWQQQRNL